MKHKRLLPAAVIALIAADLLSKLWAIDALKNAAPIVLAPVLRLAYVENTGIAFGLFAEGGAAGRWILVALALTLAAGLIYYMRQSVNAFEQWGCALMLAGAAGNMLDRLRLGYVVDFIDAHWGEYHWPAFNIADASICCGAALFAYVLIRGDSRPAEEGG